LINHKELRNAREVIKFLSLNTFCPEFLVQCPQLLLTSREKANYSINLVQFIPQFNLFVTSSNNKKQNRSNIKIYNFKESSLVEDTYLLKQKNYTTGNDGPANAESAQSFADAQSAQSKGRTMSFVS
jgi:hypothetical protein